MSITKRQILEILFWAALVIGIIMLLWKIFGSSPTDLGVILPFILMLIFKMWANSDEFKEFKYHTKLSFTNVRKDFIEIKKDIGRIENKIDNLSNKKLKIK